MTPLFDQELQSPSGDTITVGTVLNDGPTLFVLLRHFG